jgi:hypothetical protein
MGQKISLSLPWPGPAESGRTYTESREDPAMEPKNLLQE